MAQTIRVGIIGATGYTGCELVRILTRHPDVNFTALTSESNAGKKFSDVYPVFKGLCDLTLEKLDAKKISKDISYAFICLPHTEAMKAVPVLAGLGVKVIDLSADFRLKSAKTYTEWYKAPHTAKEILKDAVYALPELYREEIKKTFVAANPGCYPTGAILGLAPLVRETVIIPESIIIDSKSGVSGAGRTAKVETLYCEVNESMKAYNVATHRHTPEIEQELTRLNGGGKVTVTFVPHLAPMDRGILSTIYAKPIRKTDDSALQKLFERFYKNEPFVRICPPGNLPATKDVLGTNYCDIGIKYDGRNDRIIIVTAIDNLIKGASGQAVQNFNIMAGIDEKTALIP